MTENRKPSPLDVLIAKRMRARRTMLRLSQAELARRVGISHQQVQKYEASTDRVTAARLYAIATALEVSFSWFVDPDCNDEVLELADQYKLLREPTDRSLVLDLVRRLAKKRPGASA